MQKKEKQKQICDQNIAGQILFVAQTLLLTALCKMKL